MTLERGIVCRSNRVNHRHQVGTPASADELVYEEQTCLDALCAAGATPDAVCGGLLRFWSESARHLARAAGASSIR